MADITINWVPVNGGSYEIWYAKLSVVGTTSEPPTTGWVKAAGSPFDSALGTASILGVDNNTQYRVDTRNDCTQNDSIWTDDIRYKLVCPSISLVANPVSPSDAGASITASVTLSNRIEFESIASSITLQIRKTSDSSIVETKMISSPYSTDTLSYTFNNLLTGTNYTVYLSIQDGIEGTSINCSNQAATTQTPVIVPPPVCNAPTFSITNVTANNATINITSTLNSGDKYDISLNGGTSYTYTGITTQSFQLTGLSTATSYQIVVRLNCVAGGIGTSTSQTFTTSSQVVTGVLSMNSNTNVANNNKQGTLYITFSFPKPTPAPLTLYFGYTHENLCNGCPGGKCSWSNGYDIFTPPAGAQNCPGNPIGDGYSGPPHLPFIVNIPQGVTSYNSGTNIFTAQGGTNPSHGVIGPWQNLGGGNGARGYTDLYVKIASPSGYNAAFVMINGQNISGVTLHNV